MHGSAPKHYGKVVVITIIATHDVYNKHVEIGEIFYNVSEVIFAGHGESIGVCFISCNAFKIRIERRKGCKEVRRSSFRCS